MTQTALTREQVPELKKGRELDSHVALIVMGVKEVTIVGKYHFIDSLDTPLPNYSTDISAAWDVLNKMIYFGMEVNVGFYEKWDCALDYRGTNWCEQAETAPEAICKAALLAVLDI
ncbi:BC1872 family protein [Paenibacillus cucumis (ex Kampfer et al. 2016)]|uniref:Phage ABA sandwich domain-containing protein n=1 Tax=Paenibacillus cucumis (ex Kampfer et al. 2016) TaxID=1776858 RepID=A0ABS7KM87_9BACL|nr:hypothetical protein [Paenibacillus cucumis (ex Kampfer et al. 2016)]MBY0205283.1 hypothetical protein [Paenibacillus cucumis (ex Kampfer et al. 2016)]